MSVINILLTLLNNMGIIIVLAVILSRLNVFKRVVTKKNISFKEKVFLVLIFGLVGILGTYFGIRIKGAIANSRVIGVLVGGILGGPLVGLGAGLIAGFHRWFIDIGGFTSVACGVSTVIEGLIGGLAYKYIRDKDQKWHFALGVGIAAELLQMLIILLIARPLPEALELVKIIIFPMVTVNSIGIALFLAVSENIFTEYSKIKAAQSHLVLSIAEKTLPFFRKGLNNNKNAKAAVEIIMKMTDFAAVAITDRKKIIAHVGLGEDHHLPGHEVLTEATKKVLEKGVYNVIQNKKEIGCDNKECLLSSAVIVPLKEKEKVIGTLKIYKKDENGISFEDVELALGMAKLFSTQLELSKIERQALLLQNAELKVLQAQINPHFLFNAINTIMSYVRTNPEKARDLLGYLADYFRRNLYGKDFIELSEELNHIKAYLAIEEARYCDKIKVIFDIDSSITKTLIPSLTLQPIVENSIKHGLLPKEEGGFIRIEGKKNIYEIELTIIDNGLGFDAKSVNKNLKENNDNDRIGLNNVNNRLINIYGPEYQLIIESKQGKGTTVTVRMPINS